MKLFGGCEADAREACRLSLSVAWLSGSVPLRQEPDSHESLTIMMHRFMRLFLLLGSFFLAVILFQGEPPIAQAAQSTRQTPVRKKTSGKAQSAPPKPSTPVGEAKSSSKAIAGTLKKISWTGTRERGAILIELSGRASYQCDYLPADPAKKIPPRIRITLPRLAPAPGIMASVIPRNVPVSHIRTALSGEDTRIILDCAQVSAYAASVQKSSPFTLCIELSRRKDIKGGIAVSGGTGKKKGTAQESLAEQLGLTVETVMLDAGHGGRDPGTMTGKIVERQFTLKMAKLVGSLLRKNGFTVLYTRSGDRFLSLEERTVAANDKKADLFISLHANANNDSTVQGLETYYLDMAKTKGAATVAARENAVSAGKVSDLQFILTDLTLNTKLEESHELASCIHKGILGQIRKARYGFHDNGVRSAPFYVLTGARMPAVLVEFGYVTNKDDAAKLSSDRFLQYQAAGLVDGIVAYKDKVARVASKKK